MVNPMLHMKRSKATPGRFLGSLGFRAILELASAYHGFYGDYLGFMVIHWVLWYILNGEYITIFIFPHLPAEGLYILTKVQPLHPPPPPSPLLLCQLRMLWATPGPEQMPERMSDRILDRMSEYMSNNMPNRMQLKFRTCCQVKCQTECPIDCENICQIECQWLGITRRK